MVGITIGKVVVVVSGTAVVVVVVVAGATVVVVMYGGATALGRFQGEFGPTGNHVAFVFGDGDQNMN